MNTDASSQTSGLVDENSSLLDKIKALEPQVRAAADSIEANRCLPDELIDSLRATGLFRATWPKLLDGLELDPMTQIEALEELSRYDGSVGWIGTFAAIGGLSVATLDPESVKELFPTPDVVPAGQYALVGRAERVEGGYRVNGKWSFGSGCRHAGVITGGCIVTENDEPVMDDNGLPEPLTIYIPKEEANINLDTWHVAGMRGTGSHDYTLTDHFVPAKHTSDSRYRARRDEPLYSFPALFLFSHLPMPLGIARAALDYVYQLGDTKRTLPAGRLLKENGDAHEVVAKAEAALRSARAWAFEVMGDIWDTQCRGEQLTSAQRAMFRLCLVHVTRTAKEVVTQVHDIAASSAIQQNSPIDRLMRDIQVVCAHVVVQPKMYRPAGKVLFGLEVKNDPFF
ncbi:MAG: hydrolase [Gammaproteobacteria bacterium]|nr:MAG: hydrolase [Gammaproteobacteria bacterium]